MTAVATKKPARQALPALITDNAGGRPLDAKAAAKAIASVLRDELVKRLQLRRSA